MPYRQSLVRADITAGPHHLGISDRWEGGNGSADMGTYARATGTISLGGTKTREDGTATFLVDEAFWAVWPALDRARGQLRSVIVVNVYADDGTPLPGQAVTLTGILRDVPVPQGDFSSNEGNAVALGFVLDADAA